MYIRTYCPKCYRAHCNVVLPVGAQQAPSHVTDHMAADRDTSLLPPQTQSGPPSSRAARSRWLAVEPRAHQPPPAWPVQRRQSSGQARRRRLTCLFAHYSLFIAARIARFRRIGPGPWLAVSPCWFSLTGDRRCSNRRLDNDPGRSVSRIVSSRREHDTNDAAISRGRHHTQPRTTWCLGQKSQDITGMLIASAQKRRTAELALRTYVGLRLQHRHAQHVPQSLGDQ